MKPPMDNLIAWERMAAITLYGASAVALSSTMAFRDAAVCSALLAALFWVGFRSDFGRSELLRRAFGPAPVRATAYLLGAFFFLLLIGTVFGPAILLGMMFVFAIFLTAPGLQSAFLFLDATMLAFGVADERWIGDARVAVFSVFLGATFALHHHRDRAKKNRAPYRASARRVALVGAGFGAAGALLAFPLHFLIPSLAPPPPSVKESRPPTMGDILELFAYFAVTGVAFAVLLRLAQRMRRPALETPPLDQASASVVVQERMAQSAQPLSRPREPRWTVVKLYHLLFEKLRASGILVLESSTPAERASVILKKAPSCGGVVASLTALFQIARYSPDSIGAEDVRQMKAWTGVVRRVVQGAALVLALGASIVGAQDAATLNRFARVMASSARTYDVLSYDLSVRIDPERGEMAVDASVAVAPTRDVETLRFLIHPSVRISSIRLGEKEVPFTLSRFVPQLPCHLLDLKLPSKAEKGGRLDLTFAYVFKTGAKVEIHAPTVRKDQAWTDLATGWYPAMLYEQFDSRITLDLPAGWDGVATGVKDRDETKEGRRRISFAGGAKNELLCFACGRYHRWEKEAHGRRYAILATAPIEEASRTLLFQQADDLFQFYASRYGDPDVPEFTFVEMAEEDPSPPHNARSYAILTGHEWRFLARPQGEGQSVWYGALSHEIAHCWFGHLVASDVLGRGGNWLREGLAEYSSYLALERRFGAGSWLHRRALSVYQADIAAFGDKEPPLREMSYMLGHDTSYEKGAWVLRMLADEVGHEAMDRALARYVAEKRGGFATDADFRAIVEKESGRDLRAFFLAWEEGNGRLDLAVDGEPAADGDGWSVKVAQRGTLHWPVRVTVSWRDVGGGQGDCEAFIPEEGARVKLPCKAKPALVEVDSKTVCLDVDRTNDTWPPRVSSGMTMIYTSGSFTGEYVASIAAGSPAQRAGVAVGDWIIGVGDRAVKDPDDVPSALWDLHEGEALKLRLKRGSDVLETTLR